MLDLENTLFVRASVNGHFTLKDLEDIFLVMFISRGFNIAILALLLWDMLLTLGQEVEVIWKSRWTVVKVLFLMNRYLTPFITIAHIWTFSGYARGLNDTVSTIIQTACLTMRNRCRVIYSIATIVQVICISSVSAIVAIRLYALYRTSIRVLYVFLISWAITLVAVAALLVPNIWLRLETLFYEPHVNICVMLPGPAMWTQWLPRVTEHGMFCIFLLFNAMATPRSDQTIVLSVFYRDGVIYYALTFMILLSTLLSFRFARPTYIGLIAYGTSVGLAMATSRLLLNINSSQTVDKTVNFLELIDLDEKGNTRNREEQFDNHPVISNIHGLSSDELQSIQPRNLSHDLIPKTDEKTMFWSAAAIRRRAWWLLGAHTNKIILDAHVTICRESAIESSTVQGPQVSRLGRYDDWF